MKKLIFIILLFISFQSFSQMHIYAIRTNTDETKDTFFIKAFTDSVFNKAGVFVTMSVESLPSNAGSVYPQGFDKFIRFADGIYRNVLSVSGIKHSVITINANAGTNLVLTNQANAEQQLGNSLRNQVRVNTSSFTEARLTAYVMAGSTSPNNPRIYFQYSTDGNNWIGGGSGISLTTTGAKETAWISLPEGAKGDVYIRAAQNGGDGVADPALGLVTIQFR